MKRSKFIMIFLISFLAIIGSILAYNFLHEHLPMILEFVKNRRVYNSPFIEILGVGNYDLHD